MVELINSDHAVLMLWWPAMKAGSTAMTQRPRETEFSVEACWLSRTQEGQPEQTHPQTFMIPFCWQHWHDLHALSPPGQTVNKEYYVELLREFSKRFCRKRPAHFKSGQWHFHQHYAPVHNSILVTDYLTKMGFKTVPHPSYSPDIAPCCFWLFHKLKEIVRGCRNETIVEIKEAVTMVIYTFTQEDFHETFQKLSERYNKCISAGGDYFEGDLSFMSVLSIKVWKLIVGSL